MGRGKDEGGMASPNDIVNFRLRNDRGFNAVQASFLRR